MNDPDSEDRESEKHGDRKPPEDKSGFRKVVVSAVIQAIVREVLDVIIRVAGREGS